MTGLMATYVLANGMPALFVLPIVDKDRKQDRKRIPRNCVAASSCNRAEQIVIGSKE